MQIEDLIGTVKTLSQGINTGQHNTLAETLKDNQSMIEEGTNKERNGLAETLKDNQAMIEDRNAS